MILMRDYPSQSFLFCMMILEAKENKLQDLLIILLVHGKTFAIYNMNIINIIYTYK